MEMSSHTCSPNTKEPLWLVVGLASRYLRSSFYCLWCVRSEDIENESADGSGVTKGGHSHTFYFLLQPGVCLCCQHIKMEFMIAYLGVCEWRFLKTNKLDVD